MAKRPNNSHRRRQRQMTLRNPVAKGAYEELWFDERGNPVRAGAYEEVWSDLTGAKPRKKPGRRRRTTQPTPTVQPIAGGATVSVEPLESLSDAELKAKYKSEFPGKGRCPTPATMIKKLKDKGETAAAVVEPPKTKRRVKKPKTVTADNIAPDVPSAPERTYAKIGKVAEIDSLQGPFSIDADVGGKNSKKIYFTDANGKGYVYSPRSPKAVESALRKLAVAEISGDTPTAKDAAAIDALDKQLDKTLPTEGNLVVLKPEKTKPKRRTGAKKPSAAKKPPARRRKKATTDAGADALLAAAGMSDSGSDAGADALLAAAGMSSGDSGDDAIAAMLASNPRRNRRNGMRKIVRNAYMKRNTKKRKFSAAQKNALQKIIPIKTDASGSEVDAVIARLEGVISHPRLLDQTVAQLAEKIVNMLPALVAEIRKQAAEKVEEAAPMAPSAEDIVALIQNVGVSGAHDEARRAVDNADKPTLTRAWRLLAGKPTGRALSEANMRKAVLAFLDTKDESPGVMTETGEPTEAGGVDMPSDAEARKEIERRIIAKVAEMTGAPAPRKTGAGRKKPSAGGKKTPSGGGKTGGLTPDELRAQMMEKMKKKTNGRRNRRNRF